MILLIEMCHRYLIVFCLLAAICINIGKCSLVGRSLEICPDYSKAVNLTYDKTKSAFPNIFGIATLNVRVPDDGIFPLPITCILIIDQAQDDTGGEVTITDGGVGSRYVQIHITSSIWRGLDYKIQVFVGNSTSTSH